METAIAHRIVARIHGISYVKRYDSQQIFFSFGSQIFIVLLGNSCLVEKSGALPKAETKTWLISERDKAK